MTEEDQNTTDESDASADEAREDEAAADRQVEEEEEASIWPAFIGIMLIILFAWAGVEVFFLQASPVETLQHPALISDQGAYFEVEESGREYVVRAWTYLPEGEEGERLAKASGKLEMSVLDPNGEVVASYADEEKQKKARYIRFTPESNGNYSVRVDKVTGETPPGVQARIYTGNRQILLPILTDLIGKDTASGEAAAEK